MARQIHINDKVGLATGHMPQLSGFIGSSPHIEGKSAIRLTWTVWRIEENGWIEQGFSAFGNEAKVGLGVEDAARKFRLRFQYLTS